MTPFILFIFFCLTSVFTLKYIFNFSWQLWYLKLNMIWSKLTLPMNRLLLIVPTAFLFVLTGYLIHTSDSETTVSAQNQTYNWPQLQHNAQRTGYTDAYTSPSRIRARWIWFGSDWILRNQSSENLPTWDDDLTSSEGKSLDMPSSVSYVFAESMQPIIVNNQLFVGDLKLGKVYALSLFDGSTLWEGDNPGGTAWPGVATSDTVVFASLYGYVTGWDSATGIQKWQVDTRKTISHSPLLVGSNVYVANQGGKVFSINISTGSINWQTQTNSLIQGGLASDGTKIFVGLENMEVVALRLTDGQEVARSPRLTGQSFGRIWPVITNNRVILQTVPVHHVGSEYDMNGVIDGSQGSFANEQPVVRSWLQNNGWYYEHLYALDSQDLSKDYVVANGAVGGVGNHSDPPVVNRDGLALTWWPTYFATISRCSFGCPSGYNIDIAGINLTNGNGIQIPHSGGLIFGVETDNTFGMTMGGDIMYLRQAFRGTRAINFASKQSHMISATYRYRDCGGWQAPLNYAQGWPGCPPSTAPSVTVPTSDEHFQGHVGPAIVDGMICFTEYYGVTCMEDY